MAPQLNNQCILPKNLSTAASIGSRADSKSTHGSLRSPCSRQIANIEMHVMRTREFVRIMFGFLDFLSCNSKRDEALLSPLALANLGLPAAPEIVVFV